MHHTIQVELPRPQDHVLPRLFHLKNKMRVQLTALLLAGRSLPARLLHKPEDVSALNKLVRIRAPQGKLPQPFLAEGVAALCRKLFPQHSKVCFSTGFTVFCYFHMIFEINCNSVEKNTTNKTTYSKKLRVSPQHELEIAKRTPEIP